MMLFFVGVIEMIIATTWTKVVSDSQIVASGLITMVNIFIWYYVLQMIVDNINNWQLVVLYAFGCAIGTVCATMYFSRRAKRAEELEAKTNS